MTTIDRMRWNVFKRLLCMAIYISPEPHRSVVLKGLEIATAKFDSILTEAEGEGR